MSDRPSLGTLSAQHPCRRVVGFLRSTRRGLQRERGTRLFFGACPGKGPDVGDHIVDLFLGEVLPTRRHRLLPFLYHLFKFEVGVAEFWPSSLWIAGSSRLIGARKACASRQGGTGGAAPKKRRHLLLGRGRSVRCAPVRYTANGRNWKGVEEGRIREGHSGQESARDQKFDPS